MRRNNIIMLSSLFLYCQGCASKASLGFSPVMKGIEKKLAETMVSGGDMTNIFLSLDMSILTKLLACAGAVSVLCAFGWFYASANRGKIEKLFKAAAFGLEETGHATHEKRQAQKVAEMLKVEKDLNKRVNKWFPKFKGK